MSRYDGLIIPRSYSEYINKTDAATLLQALQLSGVMDAAPTAGSNHPVKSNGLVPADEVTAGNMKAATSNAIAVAINNVLSSLNGYSLYNVLFNNSDSDFNIDEMGPGHKTIVSTAAGGGTTGSCPVNYGCVYTIFANYTAWKWQIVISTDNSSIYIRRNINDAGWTEWRQI